MDIASIGQFVQDVGIPSALAVLLIFILYNLIRTNSEERKRAAALQDSLLQYMLKQDSQIELLGKAVDRADEQIKILTETLRETSAAKEVAIQQNIRAVETNRKFIEGLNNSVTQQRTDFQGALSEMRGAQINLVDNVNKHTDTAIAPLGTAISEGRAENKSAHTSQAESVEKQMSDLRDLMAQNGKDTRAKIDDVLKKLDGISVTIADLKTTLTAQGVDAGKFAERLNQIGLDVDNIKKELQQPAAPAPTLPPVDPLANIPPKSEEMK